MENKNFENKIIERIAAENISPKPFWHFLLRDYSLWLCLALSVFFGALAISPIFFILENLELDVVKHIDAAPFWFYLKLFPIPFILLALIFIYIAKKSWAKTKSGYKITGAKIFSYSFFAAIFAGFILNYFTVGKIVDENFHDPIFNSHKSIGTWKIENWNNPENGRYLGTVESVASSSFVLTSLSDSQNFTIDVEDNTPGKDLIDVSQKLRVVGYIDEENNIDACAIFPFDRNESTHENTSRKNFIGHPPVLDSKCKEILDRGRANFETKNIHQRMNKSNIELQKTLHEKFDN